MSEKTNALGQPAPNRTDFTTWKRENLEAFARQAADENLVLRHDLRLALDAWRREVHHAQTFADAKSPGAQC